MARCIVLIVVFLLLCVQAFAHEGEQAVTEQELADNLWSQAAKGDHAGRAAQTVIPNVVVVLILALFECLARLRPAKSAADREAARFMRRVRLAILVVAAFGSLAYVYGGSAAILPFVIIVAGAAFFLIYIGLRYER